MSSRAPFKNISTEFSLKQVYIFTYLERVKKEKEKKDNEDDEDNVGVKRCEGIWWKTMNSFPTTEYFHHRAKDPIFMRTQTTRTKTHWTVWTIIGLTRHWVQSTSLLANHIFKFSSSIYLNTDDIKRTK